MADIICDISDLPPEVRAQLAGGKPAREGAAEAPRAVKNPAQEQRIPARKDMAATAPQDGGTAAPVKKRGALKRRQSAPRRTEDELVELKVRLTRQAYDAVRDLAAEYGVSKALVIRMALSGHLAEYFGAVRYPDAAQAARIEDAAARAGDAVLEVGRQLRRVGKNYDRALHLAEILKAEGRADIPELDPELVRACMREYADITERLGEIICRMRQ